MVLAGFLSGVLVMGLAMVMMKREQEKSAAKDSLRADALEEEIRNLNRLLEVTMKQDQKSPSCDDSVESIGGSHERKRGQLEIEPEQ